jgi:hypothetical protein
MHVICAFQPRGIPTYPHDEQKTQAYVVVQPRVNVADRAIRVSSSVARPLISNETKRIGYSSQQFRLDV